MLNKFLVVAFLLSMSSMLMADTVAVNPDHPESYVVQKGDTLWDISGRFLLEPWRWPEIWKVNPQIDDPHLIYPGDVITLTFDGDQPMLTMDRGEQMASRSTVKLSPTIRSYTKDDAIPAIPIDAIKQFLTRPLVVSETEMDDWPYVVSSYDEHLIGGVGDKIYVRGIPEDATAERYALYRRGNPYYRRPGDSYTGPFTTADDRADLIGYLGRPGNENLSKDLILGYEAIYIGDAVIEKLGDPASAIVANTNREIFKGDRLAKESEADVSTNFIPHAPANDVEGNVLSAIDVVSEIGQYQVVVLDLGENDGMEVGNVLGIYQSGNIVNDDIVSGKFAKRMADDRADLIGFLGRPGSKTEKIELPEEYAGVLMVFRTFERISYALVMEATSPIHIYDTVRNL